MNLLFPAVVVRRVLAGFLLVAWSGASLAWSSPASSPHPAEAPRLVLALGGGSARGFAHVGVLRWLDEHRIPVYGVAGTSMGGLIGGLFASGLGAEEITTIVRTTDFTEAFSWDAPHALRRYREQERARSLPGAIHTGIVGGLPLGVNPGHAVGLLFSRLTLPVSDVEDLDALPVPYRAVAVDVLTARAVVLAEGPLRTAMRATMSVPGFFHPQRRPEGLLIDGGAINTLPADVARTMGGDLVLAVDVTPGVPPAEEIQSFGDIFTQSLTATARANALRSLDGSEIYVRPAVDDYEPGDFQAAEALMEIGYAAMESLGVDLSRFALPADAYAAWQMEHSAVRSRLRDLRPAFLVVEGADMENQRLAENALRSFLGQPLDLDALEATLTRLEGTGRFYALAYELASREGDLGLRIVADERTRPSELVAALDLAVTEIDDVDLGLRARLLLRDVFRRDGEFVTDLRLGSAFATGAELYLPAAGPLFLAGQGGYEQGRRAVFLDRRRSGDFLARRAFAGLDLGLGRGWRFQELRAGLVAERNWSEDRVGFAAEGDAGSADEVGASPATAVSTPSVAPGPRIPGASPVDDVFLQVRWTGDRAEHATLPQSGARGSLSVRRGLDRSDPGVDLVQAEGQLAAWVPIGGHSAVLRAAGGTTFEEDAPFRARFELGGPLRLGSLRPGALGGSNYEYGAMGWQQRLGKWERFSRQALLLLVEVGAVHRQEADPVFRHCYSANFLLDVPLGNLVAGVGVDEDGARGYVTFGYVAY